MFFPSNHHGDSRTPFIDGVPGRAGWRIRATLWTLLCSCCGASLAAQADDLAVVRSLGKDLETIVKAAGSSVVTVIVVPPPRVERGRRIESRPPPASGIVLDRAGHVATTADNLDRNSAFFIATGGAGDAKKQYRARFVGHDQSTNVAVLEILYPTDDLRPLARGDASNLALGSIVVAIACPAPFPTRCAWGMVNGLEREIKVGKWRYTGLVMTSAPVDATYDGGALFDTRGRVAGMLMSTPGTAAAANAKAAGAGGVASRDDGPVGFVMPVQRILASAGSVLKRRGDVIPPAVSVWKFLGVRGYYLLESNPISAQLELSPKTGFLVTELFEGEAARRGGLRIHDVILVLGEHAIRGSDYSLRTAIRKAPVGRDVPVEIIRGGKRRTLYVRFNRPDGR